MADIGYIRVLLAGISDQTQRRILEQAFEYTYGNLRFGEPENQTRAVNGQFYWLQSTTATDTSEFSVVHGLTSAPAFAMPMLTLNRVGESSPALTVSRVADSKRVYLKAAAGSTNLPFTLLIQP